ncbi:hypothetical protein [Planktothrix sp. FACHB-1365]|uniref:hypothetical protein n=1 Tax=Planktothrix sp. FACHB-1365 TaxID=2692855 RepID=UPI001688C6DF|nr:hypothetical protein [Planktothrix sp. FACHB-1365]MBD2484818.1 hypothetical protein [Planktothrix sp. FACHB-1365]MBD2484819.1 hypothetical protein [Planktothrix sp. FACHB-1365]
MGTQDQARSLMMRHHQMIKNRQQSLLNRVSDEVGTEPGDCTMIQGKPNSNATNNYGRSNATMS